MSHPLSTKTFGVHFLSALLLILSFHSTSGIAAETRIGIETDPATFAFSGYALHARITPSGLPHWRIGAGIYAMDLPRFIIDLNASNQNQGWKVRITGGYGLFAEYFPDATRRGWLFGAQTSLQDFDLKKDTESGAKASYRNILLMPYGGYRWVFARGFYLQPGLGLGYTQKIGGDNTLSGQHYDISPLMAFATIHTGFEF